MKKCFLLLSLSLTSTLTLADETCLKLNISKEEPQFLCRHSDVVSLNLFSYHAVDTCFVGSAQMLTDKINAGLFSNINDGIRDAEKVSGYHIKVTFWGPGKTHQKSVFKCE